MKKLIALSLAASSLVMGGTAMALPNNLAIQIEGSDRVQVAECYFLRNRDGIAGSCDYACDIFGASPRTSALSIFLRERKTFLHTQCVEQNVGRLVPTYLQSTNDYGDNEIFDVWDEKAKLLMYQGSEQSGMAVTDSSPVAFGVFLNACP
jgi:hypothetical protein